MEDQTKFIWVVSYPKSGNTWMRLMLREYFKITTDREPFETNDVSLYWYQVVAPKPLDMMETLETMQLRPAAMAHLTTIFSHRMRPRPATVVKSHLVSGEYHGVPFFSPLWVNGAVYIHRDPRDVLPSLADHMGKSLEDAAEFMNNHTAEIGAKRKIAQPVSTWSNHVLSWVGNGRVPVVSTSYEKMHEDAARELTRVLKFFEFEIDEEAVEEAARRCEFDRLQEKESEEGFIEASEHQDQFFRRGQTGSHKDEVPPHLVKKIMDDHQNVMKRLGYLDG